MFPLAELYVSPCGTLCFSFGKRRVPVRETLLFPVQI